MGLQYPKIQFGNVVADVVNADDLEVDSGTLSIDATNNRVGVGTTAPGVQLEVQDTTTSSANAGGALRLSANDGAAMGDSHRLGVIEFTGAEDTSNTQVVGARIEALTDAAWTNAENGTALYFYTTDGNASQTNVLKIDSNKKATFAGAIQANSTVTVGANDTGYDVIFYGATASANVTWDASEDDLILSGAAACVVPEGQLVLGSTAMTSTAAELNLLDAMPRGNLIIGNASAASARLAPGNANQVLTSDGTDIAWQDAAGGAAADDSNTILHMSVFS